MSAVEHVPSTRAVAPVKPMAPVTYQAVCSCGWASLDTLTKQAAQIAALDHSKQQRGIKALTQTRRSR